MGEVFRATDEQLGREVAVKLMLPTDRDPRAAERFRREARAAARLNNPHLVAVYDFGEYGDQFFLVMELVEGRTVAVELAENGPIPKDRAIDIVEQGAAGLAAAHRQGVVHRDVKPSNLLLTADGTVKVADFGIAHVPGDGATLTGTGQIVGSTLYLAPERARGGRADEASDVYALGCVLYQLVTGQPPFNAEHPTAILYQHVDTAPRPPSELRPELAGAFEVALLRTLAKDPADRPTAAEIAAGSLRGTTPTGDLAPTAAMAAAPAPTPDVETSPLQSPEPPDRNRRKMLLAGAIAVVVAAAGVATGILLNGNGNDAPPTTDIGPKPGVSSGTPGATATTGATADPTQSNATQATRSASPRPSQTASQSASQSPRTTAPTTAPTTTQSSSAPPESSDTPTSPTEEPSSPPTTTDDPPASTPPPDTPSASVGGVGQDDRN